MFFPIFKSDYRVKSEVCREKLVKTGAGSTITSFKCVYCAIIPCKSTHNRFNDSGISVV